MSIGTIANQEGGLSVRGKLNQLIALFQLPTTAPAQSTSEASDTITLDYSNGHWFPVTIGHATPTIALANMPTRFGIVVELINGGSQTITWPDVTWAEGSEPTFQASGTDYVGIHREIDSTIRAFLMDEETVAWSASVPPYRWTGEADLS